MADKARGKALDITTNYCGDHAGQYIAAALKESVTTGYMTMLENIKYERNISLLSGGYGGSGDDAAINLVQARTCDFTNAGELALADKTLKPVPLQINYQICKQDIVDDWQAAQMKAGQWNTALGADFSTFLLSRIAGIIAQHSENNIWTGAAATAGQFEGFTTAGTGVFTTDPVTTVAIGGAFTVSTVVAELTACLTAVPSAVYSHIAEDLYMYVSPTTYRMYIAAMSAEGYINAYSMNDQYQPFFEGVKMAVCPGMPDNQAVVAQASNLFYGTDLLSDETEIRVLDMAPIDGSDNIRIVAKYTGGVQTGWASDITWAS